MELVTILNTLKTGLPTVSKGVTGSYFQKVNIYIFKDTFCHSQQDRRLLSNTLSNISSGSSLFAKVKNNKLHLFC